jgi:hypothetical protein
MQAALFKREDMSDTRRSNNKSWSDFIQGRVRCAALRLYRLKPPTPEYNAGNADEPRFRLPLMLPALVLGAAAAQVNPQPHVMTGLFDATTVVRRRGLIVPLLCTRCWRALSGGAPGAVVIYAACRVKISVLRVLGRRAEGPPPCSAPTSACTPLEANATVAARARGPPPGCLSSAAAAAASAPIEPLLATVPTNCAARHQHQLLDGGSRGQVRAAAQPGCTHRPYVGGAPSIS